MQHRVVTSPIISDIERLPAASIQGCTNMLPYISWERDRELSSTHFRITTCADYCFFCAILWVGPTIFYLLTFQQEWVWVVAHC